MIETEDEKLMRECHRALEMGDNIRALTAADELLLRNPENDAALFAAGTALLRGDQKGVALQLLNAARALTKDDERKLGVIWNNIGYCLQGYHPDKAYVALKKALEYGYNEMSYDNLCNVASRIGRHAEALDWADRSGRDASYNRSFALFALGRWKEAWADYDKSAGTASRPVTDRDYGLPRWDGQKRGKVIIHGEQGVGDEIMFMSMLPKDFGGVIDCNPRTASLFQRSFPFAWVYGTLLQTVLEWPLHEKADYHLEMGGLGGLYAPEPFRRGGFLCADAARVAAWSEWLRVSCQPSGTAEGSSGLRLVERRVGSSGTDAPTGQQLPDDHTPGRTGHHRGSGGHLRVGISWTGGTWETGRARRSVPFEAINRYLFKQHPDIVWVNLEYDPREPELELAKADGAMVLNPYWATKKGAELDDLAALVSSLDLVISATNSTVDLCGALGVPVWVMTDAEPQWRYAHAAGEETMWFYESARLFRQKLDDNGDWGRVCANVALALAQKKRAQEAA